MGEQLRPPWLLRRIASCRLAADRFGRKKLLVFPRFCSPSPPSSLDGHPASMHSLYGGSSEEWPSDWLKRLADVHCRNQPGPVARTTGQPQSARDRHRNSRRPACQLAHRRKDSGGSVQIVLATSWNAQYGWRWMFTAVAVPAVLFLCSAPFIPESPRWLVARAESASCVRSIAANRRPKYAQSEMSVIQNSLAAPHESDGWRELLSAPAANSLPSALPWRFCSSGAGSISSSTMHRRSTARAGYGVSEILFNIVITGRHQSHLYRHRHVAG